MLLLQADGYIMHGWILCSLPADISRLLEMVVHRYCLCVAPLGLLMVCFTFSNHHWNGGLWCDSWLRHWMNHNSFSSCCAFQLRSIWWHHLMDSWFSCSVTSTNATHFSQGRFLNYPLCLHAVFAGWRMLTADELFYKLVNLLLEWRITDGPNCELRFELWITTCIDTPTS